MAAGFSSVQICPMETPTGSLPEWLTYIHPPMSRDEFLDEAEERGAPEWALDFMRTLPAAVFTSEEGLRHALTLLGREEMRRAFREGTPISEDGEPG